MINEAFSFLLAEINSYLKLKTGETDSLVVTPLTNDTGEILPAKLGLTLVSVEEERTSQPQPRLTPGPMGNLEKSNPQVKLNLHLLFSANFVDHYSEALKHLSHIITFFQRQNVFTRQSHPALDAGIEKLILEMLTLSLEQQNNLWASLGAKYRPSVVYKMRMLLLEDRMPLESQIPITEITKSYL